MDNQSVPGFRLSRRQFAQSVLTFVGGASIFSIPSLRWLTQASAPAIGLNHALVRSIGGVLLFAERADGQTQAMADRLAQNGLLAVVSSANNHSEALDAVDQLIAHLQLGARTIGVIGVGAGSAQALRLAHSHPAVGAVVLIGDLPDDANWQSEFALLQQHGAKTLILPGDLDESVWAQAERFVKQYAV